MRWLLLLLCAACGGTAASDDGAREDDFAKADYREDSVLPYSGDWLDVPHALAGIGQFDRLKGTVHDDAKCSTMVALSASIVGGKDHFLTLVSAAARIRASHADDVAITKSVQDAVAARALTPR